jgi:hypothetical protein
MDHKMAELEAVLKSRDHQSRGGGDPLIPPAGHGAERIERHTNVATTVRYLGIEVDNGLTIAEQSMSE